MQLMSRRRVTTVTAGLMLSLFLASMETTVVATAMPTIVGQLGGMAIYSWAFSAYMLAATTTVPIYGKLSDLFGRRRVYAFAMGLFLAGSLLCATARTMPQLVTFRAVQGLGAGGLIPLVFIMIGDLFTFEQRARIQGLFSGVWGVSSILGPLLGGFLVDRVNWQWIFYLNLIPGLVAATLVWAGWRDAAREPGATAAAVDYAGAGLLTAGVVALLLGLSDPGTFSSWGLLFAALLLFALLAWVEKRAADPVLPLRLFRDRLFAVGCVHGLFSGWALFGSVAFVPLYVQTVMGTSATTAGSTLTPLLLAWVTSSILGSRLLLRVGYRGLAMAGTSLLALGAFLLWQISISGGQVNLMIALALMGIGMGLSIPAYLIAMQSSVRRSVLGTATSTLQFSRSIGGTLGVSIMGASLSLRLVSALNKAGLDPGTVSLDRLLDPLARSTSGGAVDQSLRALLGGAIQGVFIIAFVAAALSLAATALAPGGRIAQLAARRAEAESLGS